MSCDPECISWCTRQPGNKACAFGPAPSLSLDVGPAAADETEALAVLCVTLASQPLSLLLTLEMLLIWGGGASYLGKVGGLGRAVGSDRDEALWGLPVAQILLLWVEVRLEI